MAILLSALKEDQLTSGGEVSPERVATVISVPAGKFSDQKIDWKNRLVAVSVFKTLEIKVPESENFSMNLRIVPLFPLAQPFLASIIEIE